MRGARMRIVGVLLAGLAMVFGGSPSAVASGGLPADQVVFKVSSGGGLVPPVVYALESPSLVVYGDGRILSAVPNTSGDVTPVRYALSRIDPAAVSAFAAAVESRGIINPDTDFGQPLVTDMDTTTVAVHGERDLATVSVYAFHDQFDDDLSPDQRRARATLRWVIDTAADLAAGAASVPYAPDRVTVYDVGSGAATTTATTTWPGPPPASFLVPSSQSRSVACGYLNGAPATAAYRAALSNPGALWLVDRITKTLAVNPFPLTDTCP